MPSSDEIGNWATAYAAIVATAVFVWNLWTYFKDRPYYEVKVDYAQFVWTKESPLASGVPICKISIISRRKDALTLEACGLH